MVNANDHAVLRWPRFFDSADLAPFILFAFPEAFEIMLGDVAKAAHVLSGAVVFGAQFVVSGIELVYSNTVSVLGPRRQHAGA